MKDFGKSWRDGYAFNAMIHNIRPDLVDMQQLQQNPNRVNLENAFTIAEMQLGIAKLLDAEGKNKSNECLKLHSIILYRTNVPLNYKRYLNRTYLLPLDVDVDKPDEKSIMTYVAQFLEKFPDPDADFPDSKGGSKVGKLKLNFASDDTYFRITFI